MTQRGFTAEVAAELAALVASARELDASPVVAEQTIEEADPAMWAFQRGAGRSASTSTW